MDATPGTVSLLGVPVRLGRLRTAGRPFWLWTAGLAALMIAGLFAWSRQWPGAQGLAVTGMREVFLWGFYIQNFIFFVGLSAGGLIVYSGVVLFGAEPLRPLARVAVLQAGVCVLLAMLFVVPDLGNPQRVLWFLRTPNFRSIFVFDFLVLSTYLVLCFVDLWLLLSGRMHGRLEFFMTLASLPTAMGVHSITAWVLGLVKGRELWHSAIMAPLFISSAVSSGLALLILVAWVLSRLGKLRLHDDVFALFDRLLTVTICIDLFLFGTELLTIYWPASSEPAHRLRMDLLVSGPYWPFLYGSLVLGGVLPLALLVSTHGSVRRVVAAAALVFCGIFAKRAVLLIMGFAMSPLGVPGRYVPTTVEWAVTAGIWALGALVFTFALQVLDVTHHSAEEA
ncbi:MAG: NrfD/PsrC family molybdoenzyme membrane anchor subunit [Myxococcota bacterium]